ncbi:tetratricopeptide repeat protein [Streptococcus ovuberis]|uniref:Tetratricopeptide repeat protein n=1 Tax=Streptococcus ovuberis TaxID=1936207 RepID=A0A7X6MXA7_9STRE|nr:tetratricopeptide repeat protein [Streptococcus ovuberis]NKZ19448.1 tetratricopeptide repeat protein [Streptococcus ovuberis]
MSKSQAMIEALARQDLDRADGYFKEALSEDSPDTLLDLGEYLEGIGFFPQARQIYEKLLPQFPELGLNLAGIAIEDGQTEEAFAYLDAFDATSPFYVEALVAKADFYQLEGLADVAKEKLLEATQLSGEPLLLFGLAELELELEDYWSAIEHYASLDNREIYDQTGISTYQRIGYAYAHLGKFEAAIEFLEKAIELEYDDQTLFELAALLFDQEEYQRANLYFKQLESLNPDFQGHESLYAQSLHAEHQTKEALELLERYLSDHPMAVSALLLASQYAYELKDSQQAEAHLLVAKEWAEDLEEIDLRLSSLYLEQERYEELLALEREDLDHVLTRWQIAKAYKALESDQALEKYGDLFPDLRDNPDFLKDYGYLLREYGQLTEAKTVLGQYLLLVPDDLEVAEDCYG